MSAELTASLDTNDGVGTHTHTHTHTHEHTATRRLPSNGCETLKTTHVACSSAAPAAAALSSTHQHQQQQQQQHRSVNNSSSSGGEQSCLQQPRVSDQSTTTAVVRPTTPRRAVPRPQWHRHSEYMFHGLLHRAAPPAPVLATHYHLHLYLSGGSCTVSPPQLSSLFSAKCNVYICAYATMSVSVCLSVTEVHWRTRSAYGHIVVAVHARKRGGYRRKSGGIISRYASQC